MIQVFHQNDFHFFLKKKNFFNMHRCVKIFAPQCAFTLKIYKDAFRQTNFEVQHKTDRVFTCTVMIKKNNRLINLIKKYN